MFRCLHPRKLTWIPKIIELVDRFLHCCKDNHNYNMEMVLKLQSLPEPLDVVLPDPLVELTPEAVVYHKKIFMRKKNELVIEEHSWFVWMWAVEIGGVVIYFY